MLAVVAPPTSKPVNVALVIEVGAVVTKSSAVSVSSFPGLAVRERVAILPSGLPVLKKKVLALTGTAHARTIPHKPADQNVLRIGFSFFEPSLADVSSSRCAFHL